MGGAKQKWTRMARVAKRKTAGRFEEGGDDSGGETAVRREGSELLVEKANEFFLVETIDEAAHQGAEVGRGGGDGGAVAGNVGEKDAADAAGGATRHVINVAATLSFTKGLAVNPHVETAQFDAARGKLAAAPDFHALHVRRGGFGHGSL